MSIIKGGEIVCLECLGGITLGSDMTQDFTLFHSLISNYTVFVTIFLFRNSCLQIFFKKYALKNFDIFTGKQLLSCEYCDIFKNSFLGNPRWLLRSIQQKQYHSILTPLLDRIGSPF